MPNIDESNFSTLLDTSVEGEVKQVKEISPYEAMGAPGLKRSGGWIDEEFLPALKGRKAIHVYREMSLNDPTVGSLLFTIEMLLRQVSWTVTADENTPEQEAAVQFLEECMQDMSHSWSDLIAEILSMLVYGWSWFEITYKKRVGPWEKDPKKKSKFTDSKIGWRKIEIRSQETLHRWLFDEEGGIQALVQIPPPKYQQKVVPISRSLLFRMGVHKNNPEGVSLLRRAYRPWYMKKRLEEFEAIGIERDLAGLPVAKIPATMFSSTDPAQQKMVKAFKDLVRNIRRDEHEGIVMPQAYDRETKQPLYQFELLSSGGSKQFDTASVINRYETNILSTVLADFIKLGQQGQGSYAMHVDKTGIFRASLNTIAESIAEVFNNHAIPRLFEMNNWKLDQLPKITPTNVDPPNLSELAQFMSSMGNLGMQWFPDPDLEKFLRDIAHLPELPTDVEEMSRLQAMDASQMSFMESEMGLSGMKSKAQMIAQGMTPEQAAAASAGPSAFGMAQEQQAQAEGQEMAAQSPAMQRQMEQEAMMAEQEQAQMAQQQEAERAQMMDQRQWDRHVSTTDATAQHQRAMEMEQYKAQLSAPPVQEEVEQEPERPALFDAKSRVEALEARRSNKPRPSASERVEALEAKRSKVKKMLDPSDVHSLAPLARAASGAAKATKRVMAGSSVPATKVTRSGGGVAFSVRRGGKTYKFTQAAPKNDAQLANAVHVARRSVRADY